MELFLVFLIIVTTKLYLYYLSNNSYVYHSQVLDSIISFFCISTMKCSSQRTSNT